ncbi:MAG: hypothetical protein Q8L14_35250 [Myxococcales bacterium]|nr:hypothetical protein [Myxococcales bacterium]
MRALPVLSVLSLALAGHALAQVRLVQHASSVTPNGAALAVTFPAASAAGNVIVVAVFSGGLPTSVTDSLGTSFQVVGSVQGVGGFVNRQVVLYSGATTTSLPFGDTVVVSGTSALVPLAVVIVEYSGLRGATGLLVASDASASPVSTLTTSLVSTRANDLLFWWVACEGTLARVDGGFTIRATVGRTLVADLVPPVDGPVAAWAEGSCTTSVHGLYLFSGADGGVSDGGSADAGAVDAGAVDAGAVDAGAMDAGPVDAGQLDAGSVDAGQLDAGAVDDGGVGDAGAPDGGEFPVLTPGRYAVGCDCGSSPWPPLLVLVSLLFLGRSTRSFRVR